MDENTELKIIDEELVCADALVHFLKYHCGHQEILVEREENDPPDFWFTIEGKKYAGEVTSIVKGHEYHTHCRKLEDAIRNSLDVDRIFGTYALIIMHKPKIPRTTSPEWKEIVTQAGSFIKGTRYFQSTEEFRILENVNGHLGIKKISNQGSLLGAIGPTDSKFEGEVQAELQELIGKRIKEKKQKMENKGIPDIYPIILLLYDAYGFGNSSDAEKALMSIKDYDWFHSIFWATSFTDRPNELFPSEPGRVGTIIYSVNSNWWKSPTIQSS
jgi:hypothetical protein